MNNHTAIWKRAKKVMDKGDLNGDDMIDKCEFGAMMLRGVVASEGTWKP